MVVAIGAIVAVLALAGVFSGDDEEEAAIQVGGATEAPETSEPPAEKATTAETEPELTEVDVGGRPTAVAAGSGAVWVADSFSRRAAVLDSEAPDATPTSLDLGGPATDVTVSDRSAWYALPEQRAVERRDLADLGAPGELVGLDGFPAAVAAEDGTVYALAEKAIEVVDVDSGEVTDTVGVEGFGSSIAAGDGYVWVVKDNRELVRVDPESGSIDGEPVEIPEAFGVTVGEGAVWVVAASGEVARIDPGSLEAATAPSAVRGALDVTAGLGSVWVTSSRRTVTRLDPESMRPVGAPLRVGDEPASATVGDDAVWVANGGDGTLTRIQP